MLAGECEVRDFNLERVLETVVDTGAMQPVLYAVESFEQIYEAAKLAEAGWDSCRGDERDGGGRSYMRQKLGSVRRVVYGVLLGVTLTPAWAVQSTSPNMVEVKVQDSTGAVISNAAVRVVPRGSEGKDEVRTNETGTAYVAMGVGEYEVFAGAPGFLMTRQHVDVTGRPGQVVSIALQIAGGSVVSPTIDRTPDVEPVSGTALTGMVREQSHWEDTIVPTRPIPTGGAPGMRVKIVKDTPEEKVYTVVFQRGDEVLSGLTDFAIEYKLTDAHFTGIGAVSGATVGWLDLGKKLYHRIDVKEQVEVLSLMGDVATFNGKPVVHAHLVLGKQDGSTVGGHMWELRVNPTLEIFVTANAVKLEKVPDDASGMKVIDPTK